ncbi:Winged helix DNA-binding domain-containing protein [Amphibacillus marinus]|uniref:Winged helix DNA-binding domain-containing protein n=1 Tax=Amphibacillus marinus TaxID=872970 RepID=A0A1H8KFV9_9BACI|nr:transcriptional regulator [Amphibacillus marinus]SEN91667.1 Winged helix DNA-binding domain-containing protein [Amphibacillus marinus]
MTDKPLNKLNDLIHGKARLGIMSLLMTYGEGDFSFLKDQLGLSDGNLGAHIRKLEEAGYLDVTKLFQNRKPRTLCRLTNEGKDAYADYLATLEEMLYGKERDNHGDKN